MATTGEPICAPSSPADVSRSSTTNPVPSQRLSVRLFSLLLHPALLVIISLLPYWTLPAAHLLSSPTTATGFYNEEFPYYFANGRAAFDRGNGMAYPNPYDPAADAPTIYFHWLLWIYGFLSVKVGIDPGNVLIAATFLSGLAFAGVTWKLIAFRLRTENDGQNQNIPGARFLFLLSMWGGGLLVPAGMLIGLVADTAPVPPALVFDPQYGMWFLNWGRNAIFATEAVYHVIVVMCWLSELKGRRTAGTLWCAALATTHPWSGLELLLTLNLWRAVQWIQLRDKKASLYLAAAASMLIMFLGYYKVWLPGFENHRRLEQVWELDWSLSWISAALGYCLVLIPAVRSLFDPSDRTKLSSFTVRRREQNQFLICALLTATALVFHDRVAKPVQPIHFTRGYIWMPLFLLGLPLLHRRMPAFRKLRPASRLAFILMLMLAIGDNCGFAVIHSNWQWNRSRGYHLDVADRAILSYLHREHSSAVVLFSDKNMNYLSPAYAAVRPWIGHPYNTPDMSLRRPVVDRLFAEQRVHTEHIPSDVDVLIVSTDINTVELPQSGRWRRIDVQNERWQVWILSPL